MFKNDRFGPQHLKQAIESSVQSMNCFKFLNCNIRTRFRLTLFLAQCIMQRFHPSVCLSGYHICGQLNIFKLWSNMVATCGLAMESSRFEALNVKKSASIWVMAIHRGSQNVPIYIW